MRLGWETESEYILCSDRYEDLIENKVAVFLRLCLTEVIKDDERSDTVQTSHFSSGLCIVSNVRYATSFSPSTLCYIGALQPGMRHPKMLKQLGGC